MAKLKDKSLVVSLNGNEIGRFPCKSYDVSREPINTDSVDCADRYLKKEFKLDEFWIEGIEGGFSGESIPAGSILECPGDGTFEKQSDGMWREL